MSYRRGHIKNKIYKIRSKKPLFLRRWFLFLTLFLVLSLTAIYFILFSQKFQVKDIIISGNSKIVSEEIKNVVSNYANTGLVDFAGIKITSRSIFLVNEEKINNDILEKFPIIEKLAINKNFPQTLILGITERQPLGVYCDKSNRCFLIDHNGVVFEQLTQNLPADTTIVRQMTESGQIFTGEQAIEQNIINIIYKIQNNLQDNFEINLKEALITSPLRINVETNGKWKIYFDIGPEADINLQLTKLDLLLGGGMSAKEMENLRYIDLRPKDRAIICDNSICDK